MPTLTVKLFGPQARLAEQRELVVEVDADPPTAAAVLAAVSSACPAISGSVPASKLAVNHAVAEPTDTVQPGDELALIGMLGGG